VLLLKCDTGDQIFIVLSGCFGMRVSQKQDWLYQPLLAPATRSPRSHFLQTAFAMPGAGDRGMDSAGA
jgi:hypothetical protein